MRILVTGGAGFIGSHVVDLLIENEHEVFVIDNLSSGKLENLNSRARFFKEDLCDFEKIEKIFGENRPEVVYHFAAQIDVRKSVENPAFDAETNILSTINLLELCRKYKVKHFIFSSTGGAIYGDADEIPTPENYNEKPISPYGCAKLSVEKYLHYYNFVHGMKYTVLRYSNVYGPRQNPHGEAGVVAIFLNSMLNGKNPVIFGGKQTRDFVFVEDIARANFLALNLSKNQNDKFNFCSSSQNPNYKSEEFCDDKKSEIYNVGTGVETNIDDLFLKLNKFFDNNFKPVHMEMKKGEQMKSCLAYWKIKEHLGWMPACNIDEGLKRTCEWFEKNL